MYEEKKISDEFYEQILLKLYKILWILYKSDILEDRKKTTIERIIHLREGFEHLIPLIEVKFQRKI